MEYKQIQRFSRIQPEDGVRSVDLNDSDIKVKLGLAELLFQALILILLV